MTSLRFLFICGLVSLLCACANVSRDFKFKPDGSTGLVVGSISYESGLGKYFLVAQNVETLKIVEFGFGCSIFPCLAPANDTVYSANEVPKQRGGGYAVEVEEGQYRIVGWHVVQGYMNARSKRRTDIRFTVERGKASYLGNLYFDSEWEAVQLRDKSERDLPLLRAEFSALNTAPFAYTIAPSSKVEGFGGEYQRGIEGQIFIPFVPIKR